MGGSAVLRQHMRLLAGNRIGFIGRFADRHFQVVSVPAAVANVGSRPQVGIDALQLGSRCRDVVKSHLDGPDSPLLFVVGQIEVDDAVGETSQQGFIEPGDRVAGGDPQFVFNDYMGEFTREPVFIGLREGDGDMKKGEEDQQVKYSDATIYSPEFDRAFRILNGDPL